MELKITTSQILKFLHLVSWLIFIGLCIEAGGMIFNTFFVFYINPMASQNFWQTINLKPLYDFDMGYFLAFTVLMVIVAILKALLFYLIVKLLHDKNLNLTNPFSNKMTKFISRTGYLTIGIALFSKWGENQTKWLVEKKVSMPFIQEVNLGGADVWFFMGIIFWVLTQLFKRGEAIQSENDLTI